MFNRPLRTPLVYPFNIGEKVIYKPHNNIQPKEVEFIVRKGRNTAWIRDQDRTIHASDAQITKIPVVVSIKQEYETPTTVSPRTNRAADDQPADDQATDAGGDCTIASGETVLAGGLKTNTLLDQTNAANNSSNQLSSLSGNQRARARYLPPTQNPSRLRRAPEKFQAGFWNTWKGDVT